MRAEAQGHKQWDRDGSWGVGSSTFVLVTHRYKLIRIPWGPPHLAEMNPSQPEASQVTMNWPDLWASSVPCHRVFALRRVLPLDQRGKLGRPHVYCALLLVLRHQQFPNWHRRPPRMGGSMMTLVLGVWGFSHYLQKEGVVGAPPSSWRNTQPASGSRSVP